MTPVIDRIDRIIIDISGRDIVPTSEMTDELLDLRQIARKEDECAASESN
jgi:hypothetical protein